VLNSTDTCFPSTLKEGAGSDFLYFIDIKKGLKQSFSHKTKNKIVIIEERHVRGCATEVSNYLQKLLKLQVYTGTVISGARPEAITLLTDK